MARPNKRGFDYFPLDTDIFNDLKIRKLIKRKGSEAVAMYTYILSIIYRDGYYTHWDEDLAFVTAEQLGITETQITNILDCCLEMGLFSKRLFETEKILTSAGIQKRYLKICTLCKRTHTVDEYSLITPSGESPKKTRANSEGKPKEDAQQERLKEEWCAKTLDLFNHYVSQEGCAIRPVKVLTDNRRKAIAELFAKYSVDQVKDGFRLASINNFLNGRTKTRTKPADFDWIIQPDKFIKILENTI